MAFKTNILKIINIVAPHSFPQKVQPFQKTAVPSLRKENYHNDWKSFSLFFIAFKRFYWGLIRRLPVNNPPNILNAKGVWAFLKDNLILHQLHTSK